MERAEAIVVGAGHNGLICAAYLARAGIDTLIVEARPDVGGCASTVSDLGARFNICNCDHTLIRAMPIIDELELAAHGLRYLEADAGSLNLYYDDSEPWFFFPEIDRQLDSIWPPPIPDTGRRLPPLPSTTPSRWPGSCSTWPGPGPAPCPWPPPRHADGAEGANRLLDWSRRSFDEIDGPLLRRLAPDHATGGLGADGVGHPSPRPPRHRPGRPRLRLPPPGHDRAARPAAAAP